MGRATGNSILDLPLEKQQAFAAREGLSLEAWQEKQREWFAMMEREYTKIKNRPKPEGWTEEDTERWQAKVDSSQPSRFYDPLEEH